MAVGDLLSGASIDAFIEKKLKGSDNVHYNRTFTRICASLLERKFQQLKKRNAQRPAGALDNAGALDKDDVNMDFKVFRAKQGPVQQAIGNDAAM